MIAEKSVIHLSVSLPRMMKRNYKSIKTYLELTTGSLLARRGQWASLASNLPEGALLLVVPKESSEITTCLLKIARSFTERGGKAVVHYCARGYPQEHTLKPSHQGVSPDSDSC